MLYKLGVSGVWMKWTGWKEWAIKRWTAELVWEKRYEQCSILKGGGLEERWDDEGFRLYVVSRLSFLWR